MPSPRPSMVFLQREVEDKLGPMSISSHLKACGFDARIMVDSRRTRRQLGEMKPDFIGLSVFAPTARWAVATAESLRRENPGSRIVLGGPHPTFFPRIAEHPAVDVVCRGEGETPCQQMLASYDGTLASLRDVPNLWVKDGDGIRENALAPLLDDDALTALPFADRAHYGDYPYLRKNPAKSIWTSRGCPLTCTFCFNLEFNRMYKGRGKVIRRRSVESVIGELKELKRLGWRCLIIVDDYFLYGPDWVLEFCDRYEREVGLPWSCSGTARLVTPEIAPALKRSGCKFVLFGIESGVERIRKRVYKKPISDADIHRAADALRTSGIDFLTFNILGLPNESLEDMYATVRINQEIGTTYPWCSILQPYPGLEVSEQFEEEAAPEGGGNGDGHHHDEERAGKSGTGNAGTDEFPYSYFMSSPIADPHKRTMVQNAQKLFAYLVKSGADFDRFSRLVRMPVVDRLYPFVFYWQYGNDYKKRHDVGWWHLFRYWLYANT